jgi:nitroreductase
MSSQRNPEYPIDPVFTQRWSPRAFTGEPLDDATLWSLFEAARWAPSASNTQPWRFIYARPGGEGWGALFSALVPFNQGWAERASALILVMSRTTWLPKGKTEPVPAQWHAFDTGAAWAQLALQATHAGWHAHAMGGFDADLLRASLAIPGDHALHAVVAVGRRDPAVALSEALQQRELPSQRLPLSALVAQGRFNFGA